MNAALIEREWLRQPQVIVACVDLVRRAGASELELGFVNGGVPVDQAGWYAHAIYKGARIVSQDHESPVAATYGLAVRILTGAVCRCGEPVSLDGRPGCHWVLTDDADPPPRWEPGCPVDVWWGTHDGEYRRAYPPEDRSREDKT